MLSLYFSIWKSQGLGTLLSYLRYVSRCLVNLFEIHCKDGQVVSKSIRTLFIRLSQKVTFPGF